MRISDWSSDVCSSDLVGCPASSPSGRLLTIIRKPLTAAASMSAGESCGETDNRSLICLGAIILLLSVMRWRGAGRGRADRPDGAMRSPRASRGQTRRPHGDVARDRSEQHTYEL